MKTRLVVGIVLLFALTVPRVLQACTQSWALEWTQLVLAGVDYAESYDDYRSGRISKAQLVNKVDPIIKGVTEIINDIEGQEPCDREVVRTKARILGVAKAFKTAMIALEVYHVVVD
jgi:hypothetical protein